jgi:hypothetical protein
MKANKHKKIKSENEYALKASVKVSYRVAHEGESHAIGGKHVYTCVNELAACMIDEEAARKIQLMSFDKTIHRRIQGCAANVLDEFVLRARLSESFTIQADDSTVVDNLTVLLVFVRFVYEGDFQTDLLLCKSTDAQATGEEIFQVLV